MAFQTFFYLRKKRQDINYRPEYVLDNQFINAVFISTSLLYSLIYSFPYTIIYIFDLIFRIKIRRQKATDLQNNFIRY